MRIFDDETRLLHTRTNFLRNISISHKETTSILKLLICYKLEFIIKQNNRENDQVLESKRPVRVAAQNRDLLANFKLDLRR